MKLDLAVNNYNKLCMKQKRSIQGDSKKIRSIVELEVEKYFTDLDKVLSLCFEIEYTEKKSKHKHTIISNGPYVIDINESTPDFGFNFQQTIKQRVAEGLKTKINTKEKIPDIVKHCKLNILNSPQLILIKWSQEDAIGRRFGFVPFEFRLDRLVDEEVKSPVGDVVYELRNIISHNHEESFFELVTRDEDDIWTGYADNDGIEIKHDELLNILFTPYERDPRQKCNSWCIIQNPWLLIFRK